MVGVVWAPFTRLDLQVIQLIVITHAYVIFGVTILGLGDNTASFMEPPQRYLYKQDFGGKYKYL